MKLTKQSIMKSTLSIKNVNKKAIHKPFYAKIYILILIIFLFNCKQKVEVSEDGGVIYNNKIYKLTYRSDEFTYKNHIYISWRHNRVVTITHAGHCNCNK